MEEWRVPGIFSTSTGGGRAGPRGSGLRRDSSGSGVIEPKPVKDPHTVIVFTGTPEGRTLLGTVFGG